MLRQAFYNFLFLILLASYQVANAEVFMTGTRGVIFSDTQYFSDPADGELTNPTFYTNPHSPRYRGIANSELGILKAEAYSPYGWATIRASISETVNFYDVSAGDVGHISFLMQGSFKLQPEYDDPVNNPANRYKFGTARFFGGVGANNGI